jgi:carbamoyltransferase
MKILGLHALYHDAGACLIVGDRIHAISEERLSRRKFDDAFPYRSIRYVMEIFGLDDVNEIDLVVIDHLEYKTDEATRILREELGYRGTIHPIRHHDAHAASAFFCSPFDDAAILIVDGGGSCGDENEPARPDHYLFTLEPHMYETHSTYRGHRNGFRLIRRSVTTQNHRFGLGYFYEAATCFLGFGSLSGGKLMGLASYGGGPKKLQGAIFTNFEGELLVEGDRPHGEESYDYYGEKYFSGYPRRRRGEPIRTEHQEVAHFVQVETERAMVTMARDLYEITRSPNLCVAGGVGLNSVANKKILDETPFEGFFFQPACSDTGIPLGCALYGAHVLQGRERFFEMKTAYLARPYSDEEIRAALEGRDDLRVTVPEKLEEEVALLMTQGKIIGWYQGASELGPRALGNRSIVCDPRIPRMKDTLNQKVKHREGFRPYAPTVLLEHVMDYFDLSGASPFMLLVAPVVEEQREMVPAITHVDGSARVQTVTREENGRFYRLVEAFYKLTGVPVILNTSFNVAGEPIVETPEDAIDCFMGTRMDGLVLGDCLIEALRKPPEVEQARWRDRFARWAAD